MSHVIMKNKTKQNSEKSFWVLERIILGFRKTFVYNYVALYSANSDKRSNMETKPSLC